MQTVIVLFSQNTQVQLLLLHSNKYVNRNYLISECTQSDKPKHIWSYLERLSQLKYISIRLHWLVLQDLWRHRWWLLKAEQTKIQWTASFLFKILFKLISKIGKFDSNCLNESSVTLSFYTALVFTRRPPAELVIMITGCRNFLRETKLK